MPGCSYRAGPFSSVALGASELRLRDFAVRCRTPLSSQVRVEPVEDPVEASTASPATVVMLPCLPSRRGYRTHVEAIRVGLVADPAAPTEIARGLTDLSPLDGSDRWEITVV